MGPVTSTLGCVADSSAAASATTATITNNQPYARCTGFLILDAISRTSHARPLPCSVLQHRTGAILYAYADGSMISL
jgi:hypothetical protein